MERGDATTYRTAIQQSIGLLCAAVVRAPADGVAVIEEKIKQICSSVLNIASATDTKANLLCISRKAKEDIETLRAVTKIKLAKIENMSWETSSREKRIAEERKIVEI